MFLRLFFFFKFSINVDLAMTAKGFVSWQKLFYSFSKSSRSTLWHKSYNTDDEMEMAEATAEYITRLFC